MKQAMERIAEIVSEEIGEEFFKRLVLGLTEVLELDYALVAELPEAADGSRSARTLALARDRRVVENIGYDLAGSPCANVVASGLCSYAEGARRRFPDDPVLGELMVESYVGTPLRDSAGRVIGLVAVMGRRALRRRSEAESILRIFAARAAAELERLRAEKALRYSERRYRQLFEESLDAIFVSTPGGKIVDINSAGMELFGYDSREELLQVDIGHDLYWDPWDRERSLRRLAERGAVHAQELTLKRKDGSRLHVIETSIAVRDDDGEVIAFQGILHDITERRRLEEDLRRSQRMEAVGRLAGGIAHDFNNLLTVINGQADLLLAQLPADGPAAREVGEIKAASRRAAALTRQLLILGRRHVGSGERIDLNRLIQDRQALLRQVVGHDVQVATRLAPELEPVSVDRELLEQMLLNLAINARDAMAGTGRFTIETSGVVIAAGEVGEAAGLRPGRYVKLRVEDTGEGMDEAAREHLFEPFFSAAGGETGLGLATVYGVVEKSGGTIRVESELGHGTVFEIYLPAAGSAPEPAPEGPRAPRAGQETILIAEDEPPVRSLLQQYLSGEGYEVLEAADGDEALGVAASAAGGIDLLVADVVMPGMHGSDLARRLLALYPGLKVLLISGYTEPPVGRRDSEAPLAGVQFIQKPFSTEVLGRTVRKILDAG